MTPLIPIGYITQYLSIQITFLYVLVAPSHVYESQAAAGAFLLCKVSFSERHVLVSPSHACYVSGLPQAFLFCFVLFRKKKATCIFEKGVCFVNSSFWSMFDNICPYLSMHLPTDSTYLSSCLIDDLLMPY